MRKRITIKDLFYRLMRLTVIQMGLILLFTGLTYGRNYAQAILQKEVTVQFQNTPLKKALSQLESLAGVKFVYSSSQIQLTGKVTMAVSREKLGSLLEKLLSPVSVQYTVKDERFIILKKMSPATPTGSGKTVLPLEPAPEKVEVSQPQDREITGKVVAMSNGEPLFGVSITVKGSIIGTVTNEKGQYRLSVPENATLIFSFIGYVAEEITVGTKTRLDIQLAEDLESIAEIVVIGYGTAKRKELTGSVGKVTAETIGQQPVSNPLLAMQGRISGLLITTTSGRPGANMMVSIRGQNSIGAGSDPLYIIDGIPYLATPLNQFDALGNPPVGNQSPLNSINPNDIQSIEVLKDADATAIYGSRGANGVILITTKKGRSSGNKVAINADVYSGIGQVAHTMNLMNTPQYLAVRRQAFANDAIAPTNDNAPDLTLWSPDQSTDWQKVLIGNTAHFTNAQLGFSGGSLQSQFSLSGSYRKETTVYPGDANDARLAIHATYDYTTADQKFGVSLSNDYSYDNNQLYTGDLATAITTAPNLAPYDEAGNLNWNGVRNEQNPLYRLYQPYINKTNNLISNATLRYTIVPDVNLKVNLGYNQNSMDQFTGYTKLSRPPSSTTKSSAEFGATQRKSFIIEPQADYKVRLGAGELQVLVGAAVQRRTSDNQSIYATNYSTEQLLHSLQGAANSTIYEDGSTDYRYTSLFSRLTYNWKGKYIANVSVRRDGSSRFGSGKRYGNFGAVGVAWLFNKEKWVEENLPFLSYGKVRTSYGTTGNDQIADYGYYERMRVTRAYQGNTALLSDNLGNRDYSWERVNKLDIALELGFLNDRILLTADYYRNRTTDQLVGFTLPAITGFTTVQRNLPALIQNKGWEFELNTINVSTRHFKWNSSFNLTIPENKLLKFENLATSSYADTYVLGKSINLQKGYSFNGIDPLTGAMTFADLNGDKSVTYADDRGIVGNTTPKFYGGFQNSVQYKNWQLSVFLQFAKQEGWNYLNTSFSPIGTMNNFEVGVVETWRQSGDQTDVPKATNFGTNDWYNYIASSAHWGDASYMRLKNVSLSYNFPQAWISKIKLQNCRLYLQGQNLLTLTNYLGLDPETKGFFTPPLRMYTVGIQLSL